MSSAINPSSILETYIQAQKDKFNQEQTALKNQTDIANQQADTKFRQDQAKQLETQLETEHQRNLAALDAQQAQLEASRAQLAHAHLQSKMDILKGIQEGIIPVPPQTFTPDGTSVEGNLPSSNGIKSPVPIANIPQGKYQKQPLTFDGTTLQPNEYNTAAETIKQTQPLINTDIANKAKSAEAVSQGTEQGVENVRRQPGGLYEQQTTLENLKTINAQEIADVAAARAENVAKINAAARITAANINKSAKTQIDPDELETRANQLFYGEGAPAGKTPLDLQAAGVNSKIGRPIIAPKTVDNIKALKPLENFSTDMTDFANKYLGDGSLSGLANVARLNSPITNDEQNAYNQLLLNATNIAKSVEGATGRILMAQIQVAKDFVARKNITKAQMLDNAKKINDTLVTAVEGQLGSMKPKDRVDFLSHYGFDTIAAYAAKKWKVAAPGETTLPNKVPAGWVPIGGNQ